MPAESYIQQGWERFAASDWYRRLDTAQEYAYRKAMATLGQQRDSRYRAAMAIGQLEDALVSGRTGPPDYDDGHLVVAYLIEYQLKHCVMACCVWWDFFRRHGVPRALLAHDFAAGSLAGVVGLYMAHDLRRRSRLPVIPDNAVQCLVREPSQRMQRIGRWFLESLELPSPGGLNPSDTAGLLNWGRRDQVLKVLTAFHPTMPFDNSGDDLGAIGRNLQAFREMVNPDVVLGTAYPGKGGNLRRLLGADALLAEFDSSCCDNDKFRQPLFTSTFFLDGVPIAEGFEDPGAVDFYWKSLRYRSRYRFALPETVMVEQAGDSYLSPVELDREPWSRTRSLDVLRQRRERAEQERAEQESCEKARREQERLAREERERAEQKAREKERREQEERDRLARAARERAAAEQRALENAKWQQLTDAVSSGGTVSVTLLHRNSGGWVVDYAGLQGFMPNSRSGEYQDHQDVRVEGVEVLVQEASQSGGRRGNGDFVVVRPRACSDAGSADYRARRRERRDSDQAAAWQSFIAQEGDSLAGVVDGTADFGVFVRLPNGVVGLAHISTLPAGTATADYTVGRTVAVSVLSVERQRLRLGLRIQDG